MTSILAVCAVIITGLVIRQELFAPQNPSARLTHRSLSDAQWKRVTGNEQRREEKEAPVKVAVFYDYQCPFCSRLEPVLVKIQNRYPDKVKLLRRHLPLKIHSQAYSAAVAAECARRQNSFSEYHRLLFENREAVESGRFDSLAMKLDAIENVKSFHQCFEEKRTAQRVDSDQNLASDLSITSTPTLIINRKVIRGAVSFERLNEAVRKAIANPP